MARERGEVGGVTEATRAWGASRSQLRGWAWSWSMKLNISSSLDEAK